MTAQALTVERRAVMRRRIRIVVAITITWNVIEAVVALIAGRIASSAALIGFGLDSIVEVLSAAAVAWQFAAPDPERREKTALRVIAVAFFALAVYVTVDATVADRAAGAGTFPGRNRDRSIEPCGDAVPVLVRAPHRTRAWLCLCGRGLEADPDLHLSLRRAPGRTAAQ